MPAPIVLSSVISSWVSLWTCLATGTATAIVVAVLFALLTQPRQRAGQPHRTAPRSCAEERSLPALVHR